MQKKLPRNTCPEPAQDRTTACEKCRTYPMSQGLGHGQNRMKVCKHDGLEVRLASFSANTPAAQSGHAGRNGGRVLLSTSETSCIGIVVICIYEILT